MFLRMRTFDFLQIYRAYSNFLITIDIQLHWQTEGSRVSQIDKGESQNCFSK